MAGDCVTGGARAEARPADESSWARPIELVVRSLLARLGATVEPDLIRAEVEAGFAAYSHARVREFVPVLVEARVRSRLAHSPHA
jgi:hypothetical protein